MASELRYAHAEGQTWVSFEPSGNSLVTGGCDGDIRVYKDFEDDDPKSFRAGQQVISMAVKKGCIAAGLENNTVQLYTFQGRTDGLAARFESTCYSVVFSTTGQNLAAGGGDFNIKVPVVSSPSKTKVLSGHAAPILSLAFDTTDDYLASACCDGSVRVWKLSDEKCVHTENVLAKGNDIGAVPSICGLSWQPRTGELLAIPVKNGIQMLQRISWKVLFALTCGGDEDQVVNVVSWTPCGKFLAAGTTKGNIFLFDVGKKAVVDNLEGSVSICSMQFHPGGEAKLVFADMQGQLGQWEDLAIDQPASESMDTADDVGVADEDLAAMVMDVDDEAAVGSSSAANAGAGAGFNMADESSNLSAPSSTVLNSSKTKLRAGFLDDSASESGGGSGDENEDAADADAAADLAEGDFLADDDNIAEWDEDNLDEIQPYPQQQPVGAQQRLLAQTISASTQLKEQRKALKSTVAKQQPSFQVGSTTRKQHTFFMAYNHVGMIRCKHEEADLTMLDVEFHDTSIHHAMHINNTSEYDLATLSEEAIVFACSSNAEGKNKLECRHFASWDGAKEWTAVMTKKEGILSLTIGSGFVAVATSRNLLRVWTVSGVQSFLAALPGPVVTATAYRDLLAVAYHQGIGGPHQQVIGCQVYRFKDGTMKLVRTVPLALGHKTTLTWLGFSTCGFLCAAESSGFVHMLVGKPQPVWRPVTDLRATLTAKEDNYWLVSVDDTYRQVRCLHCKDATFPPCNPRPILSVMDFSPPFCELTTEKAQLELEYSRLHCTTVAAGSRPVYPPDDVDVDENKREESATLMKMFALACKMEREARALDVCRLMETDHMLSLAQRYASRLQRITLAQRIDEIMEDRALAEDEDDLDDDIVEVDYHRGGTQTIAGFNDTPVGQYRSSTSASLSSSGFSSTAGTVSSSASGSTVGQVRLQPRAQLMERHRQHRKNAKTAQQQPTTAGGHVHHGNEIASGKSTKSRDDDVEGPLQEEEEEEELLEDQEDEEEWAAVDEGEAAEAMDDSEQLDEPPVTPKAKNPKHAGGMVTSNPFQLSGATTQVTPTAKTPSERGGSYLDKLSSTTPVGSRKRKAASPGGGATNQSKLKPLREKNSSKSSGAGGKQKQVQASLVSSLTGKPSSLPKPASVTGDDKPAPAEGAAPKGKRGRPKKGAVKKADEGGFSLWLSSVEDGLKEEYPHMTDTSLRDEAAQRWTSLSTDDKEPFLAEAKTASKTKSQAGGLFGRAKKPANNDTGTSALDDQSSSKVSMASIVPDSLENNCLEDNIVENSLDCTPAGSVYDNDNSRDVGVADDATCLSPPKPRSRSARFLDSDDDEEEDGDDNSRSSSSAPAAKKPKLADEDKASIVAASTKSSVQKLAGFAFAK